MGDTAPHEPISMAFNRSLVPAMTILGDWVEEYHLVPLAGVMVNRMDFTV